MFRKTVHCILLTAIGAAAQAVTAQEHTFVPVGDWTYTYIERLQRRGYLLELNPTELPYTRGDIRAALESINDGHVGSPQQRWLDLLRSEFSSGGRQKHDEMGDRRRERRREGKPDTRREGKPDTRREGKPDTRREGKPNTRRDRIRQGALEGSRDNGVRVGVIVDAGLRSAAGERLDVLRPTAVTNPTLEAGLSYFPNAGVHGYVERGRIIAKAGGRFDLYYQDDPDALDAANRLASRNDETYVGYDGRFASVYLGRIGRHWASNTDESTMLSRNAVSFDQIAFRIGGGRLSWTGLLGELDSATSDGRFTGTAGADSISGSVRRYLAGHRVDWRPSKKFGLSIMESSLYSSPNSGVSLKFLNPLLLHFLSVDGRPKNDENNGLVAGLVWAQLNRWSLSGQLMLDDFDFLGETGEPASLAVTGSLTYAGLASADLGASAIAVSARAYNTHQPEGRYVYLNRGLATQWSDFIHVSGFAALYLDRLIPGLTAVPKIDILLRGESDLRMPYPNSSTGFILDGTTERTIRPGIEMMLQTHRNWWIRIDAGPNLITNFEHRDGFDRTRWSFLAEFGARIRLDRSLRQRL